ncbi:MAG: L-dopachrome tautomerase-related protein [Pleurocapsa sp.]
MEIYAEFDHAVGNIGYADNGQLIFSYHPFFSPKIRVVIYDENTKSTKPFPNEDWNTVKTDDDNYLDSVLGVRNDSQGVVWMLDMGNRNDVTPKFVGWNTKTNSLERIYKIPAPASVPTSQHNDFVIDGTHKVFVIADEGIARGGDGSKGALVIVDMETGKTRRVLESHYSTLPDYDSPLIFDGKPLSTGEGKDRKPIFIGADGITLDNNDEWLYYNPLSGNKIYRIRMDDLLDETLSEEALGERVETYANKYNNGGLSIDRDANLYFTNVESRSIGLVTASDNNCPFLSSMTKCCGQMESATTKMAICMYPLPKYI